MDELKQKVLRIMELAATADRDLVADLLIDAVARGLGRKGGRPTGSALNHGNEITGYSNETTGSEPVSKPDFGSPHPSGSLVPDPEIPNTPPKPSPPEIGTPKLTRAQRRAAMANDPKFAAWYEAYPRKEAPGDAAKAWQQTAGMRPPLEQMLAALEWQRQQPTWTKDNGQFIPLPATYLRAGRWADQPTGAAAKLIQARASPPQPERKVCDFHRDYRNLDAHAPAPRAACPKCQELANGHVRELPAQKLLSPATDPARDGRGHVAEHRGQREGGSGGSRGGRTQS